MGYDRIYSIVEKIGGKKPHSAKRKTAHSQRATALAPELTNVLFGIRFAGNWQ